jgi:hypothetical protein
MVDLFMYKKTKKRKSRFYKNAIKVSKKSDLVLADYISLLVGMAEYKRIRRLERRYGAYTDWLSAEKEFIWISVPIRLNHNKEAISYLIFMKKEDVPSEGYLILYLFD